MNDTELVSGYSRIESNTRSFSIDCGLAVKRFLDIVFALLALCIFILPCLIIAFCIWLEDKHSPLFRQDRIGYKGRPFMLYKFRSMHLNAEEEGTPELYHENDSRLTKVGKFLRDHHLDELPQLWNVIRGDMSFVGHRPERRYFIDKIAEHTNEYPRLYALRPGLFSNATLYNGYTDNMEKMLIRLKMDLEYLENRSLLTDIKIIAKTTYSIISGKTF